MRRGVTRIFSWQWCFFWQWYSHATSCADDAAGHTHTHTNAHTHTPRHPCTHTPSLIHSHVAHDLSDELGIFITANLMFQCICIWCFLIFAHMCVFANCTHVSSPSIRTRLHACVCMRECECIRVCMYICVCMPSCVCVYVLVCRCTNYSK